MDSVAVLWFEKHAMMVPNDSFYLFFLKKIIENDRTWENSGSDISQFSHDTTHMTQHDPKNGDSMKGGAMNVNFWLPHIAAI